jgi:transposase
LELNRSSYYKWLKTRKSHKQLEDEKLVEFIKNLEKRHGYRLGYRRVTSYLNRELGKNYNQKRIRRLMRTYGIHCVIRPKRLKQVTPNEQQTVESDF